MAAWLRNMAARIIKTNRLPAKQNEDKWRLLHHFKVDFFAVFHPTLHLTSPSVIGKLMKGVFLARERRNNVVSGLVKDGPCFPVILCGRLGACSVPFRMTP